MSLTKASSNTLTEVEITEPIVVSRLIRMVGVVNLWHEMSPHRHGWVKVKGN